MRRAIREHLRDFVAIIVLIVLGLVTTGVIVVSQQATFPSWVPFVGTSSFDIKADIASAQAVTPGQGQTVNIAGIKVGSIKAVDLESGDAVMTLGIEPKYAKLIRSDASILLRPRTGLQDMTVEVIPGSRSKPPIQEGATIPEENSLTQVQSDQILASLDADTRGFLQLLLAGASQGLYGNEGKLSLDFRRLDPLTQDLAKLNGLLAKREHFIHLSIHDFTLLSQELANHDQQLANFVSSSNDVFRSFANQAANLRQTVALLPGTLQTTRSALVSGDRFARTSKTALTRLIPQAEATPAAFRALRRLFQNTTGPIRTQIRPFTHAVQPVVRHLGQGAAPLTKGSQALTGAFGNLNQLFNALAYNPPGVKEGYLFWASWLNHNSNSVVAVQDANGGLVRGPVLLSCQTSRLADTVSAPRPQLNTLRQLTNVPTTAVITAKGGCS